MEISTKCNTINVKCDLVNSSNKCDAVKCDLVNSSNECDAVKWQVVDERVYQ